MVIVYTYACLHDYLVELHDVRCICSCPTRPTSQHADKYRASQFHVQHQPSADLIKTHLPAGQSCRTVTWSMFWPAAATSILTSSLDPQLLQLTAERF